MNAAMGTGPAGLDHAVALVEEAVHYLLRTMEDAEGADLGRATPCAEWDLGVLLVHLLDSLDALREGFTDLRVDLAPSVDVGVPDDARELVTGVRSRAGRLLAACADVTGDRPLLAVGDRVLEVSAMALVGAIEVAAHGWDVSTACGSHRPVPADLAADLLLVSPMVIPATGRHPLFGAPVAAARGASTGDRLIAYLGRRPATT